METYTFVYEDNSVHRYVLSEEDFNKVKQALAFPDGSNFAFVSIGAISLRRLRCAVIQKEIPQEDLYGADPEMNKEEREWLRKEREKDLDPETEDDDGEEI